MRPGDGSGGASLAGAIRFTAEASGETVEAFSDS